MNIDFKKGIFREPGEQIAGILRASRCDVYVVFCTELPITMAYVLLAKKLRPPWGSLSNLSIVND
jgi:hypothetical protein